jgi:putative membrane-bound dehydrogenase-like protein
VFRCALLLALAFAGILAAETSGAADSFRLPARLRERDPADTNAWRVVEKTLDWDASRTAVVICDMWNQHWCQGATRRVGEMAPRMNEMIKSARSKGALIIHCPSDTLKFYEGTPQRKLAQSAPRAPRRPQGWKSLDATREPALPIDDSDGGCDDWPQCKQGGPWNRQIATLEIAEGDAITDSDEAYNLMMQRGITNVVVMGVHLNMCVLGRPFSIRNMVLHGQNVVFVRDLTDTMYNSRMAPFVSHFAGTDLVTEHIEKYWCPSVTSVAFLGGEAFRFKDDQRPRVVFLIGEDEYKTWETLPDFAERDLRWRGYNVRVIQQDPANKHRFPGLVESLRDADLLVVSVRRRALAREELEAIRGHIAAGRPVVGIRTASHAFAPRTEDAAQGEAWTGFDGEVLGGNYHGHHGNGPAVVLRAAAGAETHPVLNGVRLPALSGKGSLYQVSPLKERASPVLIGSIPGKPEEPVAWTHVAGPKSARVFYTSLGHVDDFRQLAFRRLLLNGMLWAMDRPLPPEVKDKAEIERTFREAWNPLMVPGTWDDRTENGLSGYDGIAWYRCQVRPPADWSERDWELVVEKVDNAYEAYVDGTKIGGGGSFPPNFANGLEEKNRHPIPKALRRVGEWLVVSIRVYDQDGKGGFKGRAPVLRSGDRVIAMTGEWQFRLGDNPAWARLGPGENLGSHLFHEVISLEKFERGGVPEKIQPAAKPLPPSESARRFTVMDGLEMELLLAEPDIAQPLQISFDERGRLWVTEYRQYPAPAGLKLVSHDQFWRAVYDKVPPPPPNHFRGADRISIHEDTDGDGLPDRHKVFVDGLNIATSSAKGLGGVWVLNPPYLLFYADRNGDDIPDGDPEVHLEGFGLEDTHSVANSLRWGPDGWLYAAQGSTVSGRVRRPGTTNEVYTLGQNIWRYHPGNRRYEVFSEGGGNAFGVEIDDRGRIFSGHNGGNTRGFHYVQGGYLQKGFEKHGQLSNPYAFGYFPQMAHNDAERFTHTFVLYGGGAFSGSFDGRLFGIEPLQGRVILADVQPEGSTFRTRDAGFAVTSADPWFKPVDIKHGPDGALYIADWYDFQVNHWRNYQGNMDAGNGRIYRLKARGSKPVRAEDLGRVPSTRLVELLTTPNRWIRQTALRLLGDRRDRSVLEPLRSLLAASAGQSALEALWGLHAVGGLDEPAALAALKHGSPAVREWTVRLLGDEGRLTPAIAAACGDLASTEPDLEVRQQLAATARRLPSTEALPIVKRLAVRDEDSRDPRQPLMLWWAVEAKASTDRTAVLGLFSEPAFWERPIVREQLLERLMRRYAQAGGREDFLACAELLRRSPSAASTERLLAGFEKAFEGRSLAGLPAELVASLAKSGGGSLALQLRAGRPGAVEAALERLADEKMDPSQRTQVIQLLGELKETRAVPALLGVLKSVREPVRVAALGALRGFDAPRIGEEAVSVLVGSTNQNPTRTAALSMLASRAGWSMQLARAVEGGRLKVEVVDLDTARQMKRHRNAELAELVSRLWPQTGRPTSAEMEGRIAKLSAILRAGAGDPYNGKKLYTAQCATCHRLFAVGGAIGPDLTPYRRDDLETLLLNLVNPSAEIREGYENYLVETKDERSLSGFIVRQDDGVVVVRGLDGQDVVLNRKEIAELRPAGLSLMPEGLLEGLDDQQIRDFFAYLRSSQPLAN